MNDLELEYKNKFPGIVGTQRSVWEQFIAFLADPLLSEILLIQVTWLDQGTIKCEKQLKQEEIFQMVIRLWIRGDL